jgi:hypothetical protein
VAISTVSNLSAHDVSVLIDFLLFAATLACVAIFHHHTLAAALTGLGVITRMNGFSSRTCFYF